MGGRKPLLVGFAVVVATFAVARARVFEPAAPAVSSVGKGDVYRGETVFQRECAACHGAGGEGGVGPALFATGLDAATVVAAVDQGRGVMPAGLVSGRERADIVTYVVTLSAP